MEEHIMSIKSCCNLKISFCFAWCHGRVRELLCFLKKSIKTFLQMDLLVLKKLRQTLRNIKFIGKIYQR